MSFILEALKRADRERRLERAPDLSSVYEENNFPRHANLRPWLWICGSILLVAIAGLMLWLEGPGPVGSVLPKGESASLPVPAPTTIDKEKTLPPSFAKGSEALQAKRSAGEASGTQPVPRPLRKTKPAPPIRSVSDKTAPEKIESKPVEKSPDPKPVPTAQDTSDPKPGPVAAVEKRKPVQPSPSVSSSPEKTPMEPAALDQSKSVEKQAKTLTAGPAKPPPVPAAKEQVNRKSIEAIPLISELAYELKEKLGRLQINVHSYSKAPAECQVFINMHRYRVGDKIGEDGPLLKEITPDGVIIDYGGGEVRLQVGR